MAPPPPFRAEVIGSYLRPQNLLEALDASRAAAMGDPENAKLAKAKFDTIRLQCMEELVRRQLDENVRPISDGEYSRWGFFDGFFEDLEGLDIQMAPMTSLRTYNPIMGMLVNMGLKEKPTILCTKKLAYKPTQRLSDWLELRSILPEKLWGECKVTLPSPTQLLFEAKPGVYSNSTYSSDAEFLADLAAMFRKEISALYDAGARSIQMDDPYITFLGDPKFLEGLRADGQDADSQLDMFIKFHNDCLLEKPQDLHIGIHICRGNMTGGVHFAETTYEPFARMLKELDYDTFYLEYDDERSGSFSALQSIPRNKMVVLGLVSTKTPELENVDTLVQRLYEAADTIAEGQSRDGSPRTREDVIKENLAVSPQCGFAGMSMGGGQGVTPDACFAKLGLLREIVKRVWPGEVIGDDHHLK